MRLVLTAATLSQACAESAAPANAPRSRSTERPSLPIRADEPQRTPRERPTPAAFAPSIAPSNAVPTSSVLPPVPHGFASAGIYVERGRRQPLSLQGEVTAIDPAHGDAGRDAWMRVELAASGRQEIRLSLTPSEVTLPFSEGNSVRFEIDCRKGGWTRVCDGIVRTPNRRLLMAIAGSGDPALVEDWRVERGPLALSESHGKVQKAIRHTYSIVVHHARQTTTVEPHEWQLLLANDGAWLVEGHAVRWEGERPPDAPDYLHYAIIRAR